jgi:hypothetical protein
MRIDVLSRIEYWKMDPLLRLQSNGVYVNDEAQYITMAFPRTVVPR